MGTDGTLSSGNIMFYTHELRAAKVICINQALDMDGGGGHEATPSHPTLAFLLALLVWGVDVSSPGTSAPSWITLASDL